MKVGTDSYKVVRQGVYDDRKLEPGDIDELNQVVRDSGASASIGVACFDGLGELTCEEVLLGADHAHVAVGLLLDLWLIGKLVRGMTPYRRNALRAVSFYWLAVNVLTLVVTLTVLSPAFAR